MSGVQHKRVNAADAGQRLDRWFRQHFPQVKQGQLQKLLRKGQIRVNGGRVQADRRLEKGEEVRIPPLGEAPERPRDTSPGLSEGDRDFVRGLVLYEDDEILALNKPFGMPVQGGTKAPRHIDGMLVAFGEGERRPRLAHRLDRDTGGVLLTAKTRKAAARLTEAFKRHHIQKTYWALTRRVPHPLSGRIDLAVEKGGPPGRETMRGTETGKRAVTDFQTVEMAGQRAAFLALRPHTGRTHQIRVHLAALKTPIVGDRKYGGEDAIVEGLSPKMHLFCRQMVVPLPGRAPLTLTAPLTGHMAAAWEFFDFPQPGGLEWPDE